jgi:hypothetical protein
MLAFLSFGTRKWREDAYGAHSFGRGAQEAMAEARLIAAQEVAAAASPTCDHGPRRIPARFARRIRASKIRAWTPRADVAAEARAALALSLSEFVGEA